MGLISTMFESSCTGQRPTIGRTAAKGVTQDPFATLFTGYPCSYQEASASVLDVYGQRNTVTSPEVHFARDPHVEVNDRLIVTCPRTGEIIYCLVEGEAQAVARGRIYKVQVKRVRGPK